METAAAVLAFGDLVLRVGDACDRCANAPKSFENLLQDLRAFHSVLRAVQPSFPPASRDSDDILAGCDQLLCDITKLLSKHGSLSSSSAGIRVLHRLSWVSVRAEIKELRSRLSVQVGMLNTYLM